MTFPSMNYSSVRSGVLARIIATSLFVASASLLQAQIFTEVGDAGQTPGTTQNSGLTAGGTGSTVTILGNIGPTNANDADVFRLTIANSSFYSFSTVNALTGASGGLGGLDTQLFLFNSAFQPVLANDDANGFTLQSNIPISLAPGVYYGMAAGISPTTWADFDNGASFPQTGAYQINIINVPESGSTLILTLGAVGALFVLRRFVIARNSANS
jgi:hypothetical protein